MSYIIPFSNEPPAIIRDLGQIDLANDIQTQGQDIAKGVTDLLKKRDEEFEYSEDLDKVEMSADPPEQTSSMLGELNDIQTIDQTPTISIDDVSQSSIEAIEHTPTIDMEF